MLFHHYWFITLKDDVDAVSRHVDQSGPADRCVGGGECVLLGKATLKVRMLFIVFTAAL